ncbi:ArgP/LysG family DNA-binding transcriptional regulator [Curtobacterium sp. S6]|uniref:ArgP/LysG family DNA-binding transcriptional regulator n=1 Tax=Curtobacterium sp. S6 TaxID=1479623 RepID=UPI0004AA604A|nr:ArgP/LysG family DNA-binding transcriptional regulator [Curtobacterium sp. S6]
MKRFTAEQLRTFATVVEEQTFEEAAIVLRVSASAISQRIKAMEQACGQILLRRSNPVEPTDPGRAVLRLARQIELLTVESERELAGEDRARRLAIAANSDSLATWLLDALARIPREERIYCEVRREDERHSSGLLRSGGVMGALTVDPQPVQGCSVELLGTTRYTIAAAPDYVDYYFPQLSGVGGGLTERQLAAAPMIQFDRKDVMLDDMAEHLAEAHGVRPQYEAPRVYIPSSTQYYRAVRLGMGWGAVPDLQAADDLADGSLVPLIAEPVDLPLYWQRWTIDSPALQTVTEVIRQTARERLRQ